MMIKLLVSITQHTHIEEWVITTLKTTVAQWSQDEIDSSHKRTRLQQWCCKLITKTKLNYSYNDINTGKPKRKEKKNYTRSGLHTHTSVILNQKAKLNLIVDEHKCR